MKWISVKDRVPEDRRKVHTWGFRALPWRPLNAEYLGVTRFNRTAVGGKFDIEHVAATFVLVVREVTHWAEIEGPSAP